MSNEFYALFLDPLMVYSCAYYRDPDGKLEQAQAGQAGSRLPEAPPPARRDACSTSAAAGGASAIWAAQHYGVRAHGVTLSRAQADWAADRIKREGLEGRCLVEHRDFRDLPSGTSALR